MGGGLATIWGKFSRGSRDDLAKFSRGSQRRFGERANLRGKIGGKFARKFTESLRRVEGALDFPGNQRFGRLSEALADNNVRSCSVVAGYPVSSGDFHPLLRCAPKGLRKVNAGACVRVRRKGICRGEKRARKTRRRGSHPSRFRTELGSAQSGSKAPAINPPPPRRWCRELRCTWNGRRLFLASLAYLPGNLG